MKFLRSQGPVHLFGQGSLEVIEGEILLFGRKITSELGQVDIFAPRCNGLPFFEVLSNDAEIEFTSHSEKSLTGLESTQPNFASLLRPENQNDFQELAPGLYWWRNTHNQENHQALLISETWKTIASQLEAHSCPVVFVCGQRKVGKSTFARYLTNVFLNRFDGVEFIDLDPGQCEFTTPGFLSRHTVQGKGLFGPPFTHLCMPDDSVFLGSSSTAEIPVLYCKGITEIARRLQAALKIKSTRPVVINMMGWMTGLGFEFLQYAIKTFRPTHVYSFSDAEVDKDGCDVIRKALTAPSGLMSLQLEGMTSEEASFIKLSYLSVPNADQPKSKFHPSDWRNLSYWAYFFGSYNQNYEVEGFKYSCFSYLRPVIVPLRKLQLACTKQDIDLFELLGDGRFERLKSMLLLRLVGFSLDDKFKPTRFMSLLPRNEIARVAEMSSFGVGLIRAITPVKQDGRTVDYCFEIVTPVPLRILKQANTLVFGSQMIPNNLFMNDNLSAQVEASFFSTQNPSDAAGADARATRDSYCDPGVMDPELEALRRKRLAELQGSSNPQEGTGNEEQQRQKMEQAEQARQSMLSQILTPEARDRLIRISLVKPEKARFLEDSLIQAVRSGQLRGGSGPGGRVSESDLIGMLEQVSSEEEKRKTKIVFARRRELSDSDSD